MKKQIVIAQRGWVFIGDVTEKGDKIKIENCKNIRRWGTTMGLGQLAIKGPQPNTILDDYGIVELHKLSIVACIDVIYPNW